MHLNPQNTVCDSTQRTTVPVMVGKVQVGGLISEHTAPIIVQAMTNTPTADAEKTAQQINQLAEAGAELVRFSVDTPQAAAAVPQIKERLNDIGCDTPLIGDFHYIGHKLLADFPDCAQILDKYRINPGNVGKAKKKDERFAAICKIAADNGKAMRIGVNAGSLDQELVAEKMNLNLEEDTGKEPGQVLAECMIESALRSTESALEHGLSKNQIIISCKTSEPQVLIALYRELTEKTEQPLHLGLTEAGMGIKGTVWSAASMAVLLNEGIGDTIRVSLTPRPGGDRRDEVYAACELLQALALRSFAPTLTTCPGCGRTTSTVFQELAERVQDHIREMMPQWRKDNKGVENLKIAVMGCIVNGPGESKAANIGISLPGTGEEPLCPVYENGHRTATLSGSIQEITPEFLKIIDNYVDERY